MHSGGKTCPSMGRPLREKLFCPVKDREKRGQTESVSRKDESAEAPRGRRAPVTAQGRKVGAQVKRVHERDESESSPKDAKERLCITKVLRPRTGHQAAKHAPNVKRVPLGTKANPTPEVARERLYIANVTHPGVQRAKPFGVPLVKGI
jgi:hypothetical protein